MFEGNNITTALLVFLAGLFIIQALVPLVEYWKVGRKKKLPTLYLPNKQSTTLRTEEIGGMQFIQENISITSIETLLSRRFEEAQEALKQYDRERKISAFANGLLIFGQYIIGGMLTVSFVQTTVAKENLGFIGLMVLLATLLRQFYRADIKERSAKSKSRYLKWLIRKTENSMALAGNKLDTQKILDELTQGLDKVDHEEEWEKEEKKDK